MGNIYQSYIYTWVTIKLILYMITHKSYKMKEPRLKAIVAVIISIISLLAVINFGITDKENNCQKNILFLQANNTYFFYRAVTFSNLFTEAVFSGKINKSQEDILYFGETFNSLQKQSREIGNKISAEISRCSNLNAIKNMIFISQLILSGLILYLTTSVLQKTK